MTDKQPMQADGEGLSDKGERPSTGRKDGGESGGGAYPNPQSGKEPQDGFLGHGGQTDLEQKLKPGEPDD
jgi:hypothetical protein